MNVAQERSTLVVNMSAAISSGQEIGVGLYTVPRAAQLVAAHQAKLRSWIDGNRGADAGPIIYRDLPNMGGKPVMSFLDLVESAFVRHFLSIGYSPQTIRKVAEKLRSRHDVRHPFAMDTRFRADGLSIFEESVDSAGERRLLNLMNDNFVMKPVVEESLFDSIFYAQDLARRWTPIPTISGVIIDPALSLGKPIVASCGIPTSTLFNDFELFGNVSEVADEYEISESDVEAAIQFEGIVRNRDLH